MGYLSLKSLQKFDNLVRWKTLGKFKVHEKIQTITVQYFYIDLDYGMYAKGRYRKDWIDLRNILVLITEKNWLKKRWSEKTTVSVMCFSSLVSDVSVWLQKRCVVSYNLMIYSSVTYKSYYNQYLNIYWLKTQD